MILISFQLFLKTNKKTADYYCRQKQFDAYMRNKIIRYSHVSLRERKFQIGFQALHRSRIGATWSPPDPTVLIIRTIPSPPGKITTSSPRLTPSSLTARTSPRVKARTLDLVRSTIERERSKGKDARRGVGARINPKTRREALDAPSSKPWMRSTVD